MILKDCKTIYVGKKDAIVQIYDDTLVIVPKDKKEDILYLENKACDFGININTLTKTI